MLYDLSYYALKKKLIFVQKILYFIFLLICIGGKALTTSIAISFPVHFLKLRDKGFSYSGERNLFVFYFNYLLAHYDLQWGIINLSFSFFTIASRGLTITSHGQSLNALDICFRYVF